MSLEPLDVGAPRHHAAAAAARRTVAFVDLRGFTAYTQTHGGAAAIAVVRRLRSVVTTEAGAHRVEVTKWTGDGALVWGRRCEDVVRFCEVVRDLIARDGSLPLCAGVAEGRVTVFDVDEYVGAPVNIAARLCDTAAAHQILVDAALALDRNKSRALAPIRLRGIPGLVAVREVCSEAHPGPRFARPRS